jgi:hypothetical protein
MHLVHELRRGTRSRFVAALNMGLYETVNFYVCKPLNVNGFFDFRFASEISILVSLGKQMIHDMKRIIARAVPISIPFVGIIGFLN